MGEKSGALQQIDGEFSRVFGGRNEESVVESLIRSSARSIVLTYPDCDHRSHALASMVAAAEHLKKAEAGI